MFWYSYLLSHCSSSSNFRLCWPYSTKYEEKFASKANPAALIYFTIINLLFCVSVFPVLLALGMKINSEAWQMSDATNSQKVEKENCDVLVSDSLLVFSCLLEVLGLLFQDLRVSWYKSQELSKRVSFELNAFDSPAYTTDLPEDTWTAARAVLSAV